MDEGRRDWRPGPVLARRLRLWGGLLVALAGVSLMAITVIERVDAPGFALQAGVRAVEGLALVACGGLLLWTRTHASVRLDRLTIVLGMATVVLYTLEHLLILMGLVPVGTIGDIRPSWLTLPGQLACLAPLWHLWRLTESPPSAPSTRR